MRKEKTKHKLLNAKHSKGITLVALIITIIVLLILAVVSIGAIKNSKIISHSQNAANEYTVAREKEQLQLVLTEWQIQKNTQGNTKTFKSIMEEELKDSDVKIEENEDGTLEVTFNKTVTTYKVAEDGTITAVSSSTEGGTDNPGGGTAMPVATIDVVVSENSTINGEAYSSSNPVIPKGFKAIDTETSSWIAEEGPQVSKGLVISDGTSEFVWIPVATLNNFARLQDGSTTNYRGVLYTWRTDNTEMSWPTDRGDREPVNLSGSISIPYQTNFNNMVESVAEYEGFYVGRYETSVNENTAQSKSDEIPINGISWNEMYTNSLTYSTSNSSLGVVSEMMWGCQWDAMLKSILNNETDANHVTSDEFANHSDGDVSNTGYTTSDVANNIYDLEGNLIEATQEATNVNYRTCRGGCYSYEGDPKGPAARTEGLTSGGSFEFIGYRLSLYVKVE